MAPIRLGDLLLEAGLVKREQIQKALSRQRILGGLLGTNLLDIDAVHEATLLSYLGRQVGSAVVSANELIGLDQLVLEKLPRDIIQRFQVIPYRLEGNTLLIASATPSCGTVEQEIQQSTELMARSVVGLEVRIQEALARYYRVRPPLRVERLIQRLNQADSSADTKELTLPKDLTRETKPLDQLEVPDPQTLELLADAVTQEDEVASSNGLWRDLPGNEPIPEPPSIEVSPFDLLRVHATPPPDVRIPPPSLAREQSGALGEEAGAGDPLLVDMAREADSDSGSTLTAEAVGLSSAPTRGSGRSREDPWPRRDCRDRPGSERTMVPKAAAAGGSRGAHYRLAWRRRGHRKPARAHPQLLSR